MQRLTPPQHLPVPGQAGLRGQPSFVVMATPGRIPEKASFH
ncbi:MAG: hypothetical protein AAF399_02310 [Bacteroidota bacterium]